MNKAIVLTLVFLICSAIPALAEVLNNDLIVLPDHSRTVYTAPYTQNFMEFPKGTCRMGGSAMTMVTLILYLGQSIMIKPVVILLSYI
jgi:hypothetical protein